MNTRFVTIALNCILCLCVLPTWAQQSPSNPNALIRPGFVPGIGVYDPGIHGVKHTPEQQAGSKSTKSGDSTDSLSMDLESVVKIGGKNEGLELRVFAGKESFEPILDKKVTYGDLPKSTPDMMLTLNGPLPALEFLDALSTATQWNIVATPGVIQKELNFWLNKMSPVQAISVLKF